MFFVWWDFLTIVCSYSGWSKRGPDRHSGTGGYIVSSVYYPVRKKVNPPKKGNLGTQMVIFVVYFI